MRKYYLDNIRWATVLLVVVYHVFYMYNAVGVQGGIGGFYDSQPWDLVCTFIYPWFMVLLFAVAGISAKYALQKQTTREFLKSKVQKLLVPSTLGLLLLPSLVGYIYIRLSGALDQMPAFLVYPISVLSGVGPLWFLHLLFLYSCLLVLLRKLPFWGKLEALGETASLPVLILLALPVWGAAQILNMPVITTYRFGIYFLAYLLGYLVLSHDAVQERLEKAGPWLLAAALAVGAGYCILFYGQNYAEDRVLRHLLTNVYLWLMALAILGCGKAWADRTGKLAGYLTRSSFGIYITHYLITLLACLLLKESGLPLFLIYLLACLLSVGLSFVLYELLHRIPVIRYLAYGIRKKREGHVS